MAHKVLQVLQKKEVEVEHDEFRKIPTYLRVLGKGDPPGHFMLETDLATERFQCRDLASGTNFSTITRSDNQRDSEITSLRDLPRRAHPCLWPSPLALYAFQCSH